MNLDEIVEVEVGCREDGGIGSTTTLYTREYREGRGEPRR
jgi:hypothetical protein